MGKKDDVFRVKVEFSDLFNVEVTSRIDLSDKAAKITDAWDIWLLFLKFIDQVTDAIDEADEECVKWFQDLIRVSRNLFVLEARLSALYYGYDGAIPKNENDTIVEFGDTMRAFKNMIEFAPDKNIQEHMEKLHRRVYSLLELIKIEGESDE